jgi:hypothetical protein
MRCVRPHSWARHAAALALACSLPLALQPVKADPITGQMMATWTAPRLVGYALDGATGARQERDATETGACNIAGCPVQLTGYGAGTLAWGVGDSPISSSVVSFVGANFVNAPSETLMELGRLTFTNGSSFRESSIYGATLTLQVMNGAFAATDPLSITVVHVPTSNAGNDLQNADFLDFGVATFGGSILPVTFNVMEDQTATAIIYGRIVGDPQTVLSSIVVAPGSAGAGFIGSGLPVSEPPAVLLVLAALGILAVWRSRTRPLLTPQRLGRADPGIGE